MSLSKEEFISQNKLANDCIILEPWEDFRINERKHSTL